MLEKTSGFALTLLLPLCLGACASAPRKSTSDLPPKEPAVIWIDPLIDSRISVEGLAWFKSEHLYRRLPADPENKIFRTEVKALADQVSGGQLRFRTDSPFVKVRVTLRSPSNMDHMPATGQSGVDLYYGPIGRERFCMVSRFEISDLHYDSELCSWPNRDPRDIRLNLPLYNGIKQIEIGIAQDARLEPPVPLAHPGRIVAYGTSITQGGVASRPGLSWSNQLGRMSGREVINLGFNSQGMGDPEIARLIGEIDGIELVIVDYEANARNKIFTTLEAFIQQIRIQNKKVAILVLSQNHWTNAVRYPEAELRNDKLRAFQKGLVEQLRQKGDQTIFFGDGYQLMPAMNFEEGTVDGAHPNDLGMTWTAQGLFKTLHQIGIECKLAH